MLTGHFTWNVHTPGSFEFAAESGRNFDIVAEKLIELLSRTHESVTYRRYVVRLFTVNSEQSCEDYAFPICETDNFADLCPLSKYVIICSGNMIFAEVVQYRPLSLRLIYKASQC